jgi:hypothetical protein
LKYNWTKRKRRTKVQRLQLMSKKSMFLILRLKILDHKNLKKLAKTPMKVVNTKTCEDDYIAKIR